MPSELRTKFDAEGTFTITLASLANGAGRQSTLVSNPNNRHAAIVSVKVTSHASLLPTAGSIVSVYLLRNIGSLTDDNAGANDAAITIENAQLLATLVFTATTGKAFQGGWDTSPFGPLGPTWGIAIVNSSGQALNATTGNHEAHYRYYVPEAQ